MGGDYFLNLNDLFCNQRGSQKFDFLDPIKCFNERTHAKANWSLIDLLKIQETSVNWYNI